MPKIVLFQTIQFSISTVFSSIRPKDRTVSRATSSSQSGPKSMAIKRYTVFPTPQHHWSLTIRMLTEWGFLLLCGDVVGVFYSPSWLGHPKLVALNMFLKFALLLTHHYEENRWMPGIFRRSSVRRNEKIFVQNMKSVRWDNFLQWYPFRYVETELFFSKSYFLIIMCECVYIVFLLLETREC